MTALDIVKQNLPADRISCDAGVMASHLVDWRRAYQGKASALLQPRTTSEVAKILEIAKDHHQVVVPQGGNTGLVGGGIPSQSGSDWLLSLSKMNKIEEVNIQNRSMTVQAGTILQDIHTKAAIDGLYFPLNLAAKGSCSIGGNMATNAGGVNVLRYGTTRDLILGLEVVLMGGEVMDMLTPLRKDNTGYDLKNLFIGSEGTLGIITRANLKLFALPKARATAIAAISDVSDALPLLSQLQQMSGEAVEAFELMPKVLVEAVLGHFPTITPPLSEIPPYILLMEIASSDAADGEANAQGEIPLQNVMMRFLEQGFEKNLIKDATLAQNEAQRQALWDIRENAPEIANTVEGPINTDIAVARADVPDFYKQASAAIHAIHPATRICGYGHLGDGNLHFNLYPGAGKDEGWQQNRDAVKEAVYQVLADFNGSISAEHGIGQMKAEQLKSVKAPALLNKMRAIKQVFDPENLLNPGKILQD